jgi:hypothetical protein
VLRHGHAFVGPAPHLPEAWSVDAARLAAAGVRQAKGLVAKPGPAVGMINPDLPGIAAAAPHHEARSERAHGTSHSDT